MKRGRPRVTFQETYCSHFPELFLPSLCIYTDIIVYYSNLGYRGMHRLLPRTIPTRKCGQFPKPAYYLSLFYVIHYTSS